MLEYGKSYIIEVSFDAADDISEGEISRAIRGVLVAKGAENVSLTDIRED